VGKVLSERLILVLCTALMVGGYAMNVSFADDAAGNNEFPPVW
jgi:hypothetical protein